MQVHFNICYQKEMPLGSIPLGGWGQAWESTTWGQVCPSANYLKSGGSPLSATRRTGENAYAPIPAVLIFRNLCL